jgi:hypothetical protein
MNASLSDAPPRSILPLEAGSHGSPFRPLLRASWSSPRCSDQPIHQPDRSGRTMAGCVSRCPSPGLRRPPGGARAADWDAPVVAEPEIRGFR